MNEELLALFFKYSKSFFLIRKVSNYNRKVCVFIRKTWFLPHSHKISSGYAFFLKEFSTFLEYALYLSFFQEIIFKKWSFWTFEIRTFELQYYSFDIWEYSFTGKISFLFTISCACWYPGRSHYLLANNDWGSTNFYENNDWGSQYFRRVIINCYNGDHRGFDLPTFNMQCIYLTYYAISIEILFRILLKKKRICWNFVLN